MAERTPAERPSLVLASGSPRRQELLARLGLTFTVAVPDVDESPAPEEAAITYVERLARAKAVAVAATAAPGLDGAVILGADTAVELDGTILGKPEDRAEARDMLGRLAGRTHRVHTGIAVTGGRQGTASQVVTSEVTFRPLAADEIAEYVATGEPLDKAGAYGIQGRAGRFVTTVAGSLSNVVGLPLAQTAALLTDAGLAPLLWGPPRE